MVYGDLERLKIYIHLFIVIFNIYIYIFLVKIIEKHIHNYHYNIPNVSLSFFKLHISL